MPELSPSLDRADIERVNALSWYHTIDVAPGVVTPGWFDLRHALDLLPFPDVAGKRCLDIGTWDGFYAYELERRGAAEVVALDVPDLTELDYPPEVLHTHGFDPSAPTPGGQPRSAGFELLHEILDSKVKWTPGSIYDLDPGELGTFDVVVVGSLLVHLRDPVRALDAVRSVTGGSLMSVDYVHPPLELRSRNRPLFELAGQTSDFQWWLASSAGLRRLLDVGGFRIEEQSERFLLRFGPRGLDGQDEQGLQAMKDKATHWALARDRHGGHLHRAFLATPRF